MPFPPVIPPGGINHPVTVAWMAVQELLRKNSVLTSMIKTMVLMDGEPGELDPPTEGVLNWLRVMPVRTPMAIGSESEWECDFRFTYEIAVRGTRAADMINVFGAFVTSLSQSTTIAPFGNVQAYYRDKNIRVLEITEAGIYPIVPSVHPGNPAPPPFMYTKGSVHGQVFFAN